MTQYRVQKRGIYYYPQYRCLFCWCDFDTIDGSIYHFSLEDAYDYIEEDIKQIEISKQRKIYPYPPEK